LNLYNNVVKETLHTNYYGTLAVTRDLLPLIRSGGRLVNVASVAGQLSFYSTALKEAFISASKTSVEAGTALMEKFTADVKSKKEKAEGWPSAAYAVSKAGVIVFTKAIALEEEKSGRGVLVSVCCPGRVNTDMTKGKGPKTPDQGAKTPVMLALGEFGGVAGGFWQNERIIEW
jgi:carbonyl reductase 1